MDLEARKYNFIQELFSIDEESIMATLERVLKQEKEENQKVSAAHKKELDSRLESYKNNPDNLLEWKDVKHDW
ncbi:addiction module protein [Flavobacterium fluviatile]|uniref:addiction module protein n=1 Tax=Flavobacterium fluviatile TaxID=1862387 RepID=UPI0013D427D0|nr:addiction module protein [Flavobacterium fluviatile]